MEAQAISALSKILLTPQNLGIMIAAWFLIALPKRMFPEFFATPIMKRLLPLMPMLLCMALIWLPGLRPKNVEWGWMLILGILLGWGVGHLHKVIGRSILGQGLYVPQQAPLAGPGAASTLPNTGPQPTSEPPKGSTP